MRLSDDILFAKPVLTALLRRTTQESVEEEGNGQFCLLLQKDGGDFIVHHDYSPQLRPEELLFGQVLLRLLNKELHHDGAWVMVWTNPGFLGTILELSYKRFVFLWMDADGDVQFAHDWMEGENDDDLFFLSDVIAAGPVMWGDHLEASWVEWHRLVREVIDPNRNQTIRAAQGEKAERRVVEKST